MLNIKLYIISMDLLVLADIGNDSSDVFITEKLKLEHGHEGYYCTWKEVKKNMTGVVN